MNRPRWSTSPVARHGLPLAAAGAAVALIARALVVAARCDALKLPAAEARPALDEGRMVVLDVRTDRERSSGTIPGAVATSWRDPRPPGDNREVLVVCSHGGRSLRAVCTLRKQGIEARSLRGGMKAYERHGGVVGHA